MDDHGRLAQWVWKRRTELGLSRPQVRDRGGPSVPTIRDIESTTERTVSATTLSKLDAGLEWEPGSAAEILSGREPRPRPPYVSGRAAAGPDMVRIGVPIVVELLSISKDLESAAKHRSEMFELQELSDRLASALHPIYGEFVTGLFETNRREHGVLSPTFAVFGQLLDEPNDSDEPGEQEERSYRRWLAGRDQQLDDETRARFERRFTGGEHR